MNQVEKSHWRCRWFGHQFESRESVVTKVAFAPTTADLIRRSDLQDVVHMSTLLIMDDYYRSEAVEAALTGRVVTEDRQHHYDICPRCGSIRQP